MKEITLNRPGPVKVKVDGHVFELKMSDVEIMKVALAMHLKYENEPLEGAEAIVNASQDVTGTIDRILGDGAVELLAGGQPVMFVTTLEWMKTIANGAVEACAEELEARYA